MLSSDCHAGPVTSPAPTSVPRTARDRARAQITAEILASARRQLAEAGADALSLRAVARDLGMASSAVYRYVASRDELLTRLIVDAYDALGAAAEAAEAAVPRDDVRGRFVAVAMAVRGWGLANPHEYALIYGTPVPGYAAPQATVGPATRVPALLVAVRSDAAATGRRTGAHRTGAGGSPPVAADSIDAAMDALAVDVPRESMLRGMLAWTALFGLVSFELFGHLHNVVDDAPPARDAYAAHQVALLADHTCEAAS